MLDVAAAKEIAQRIARVHPGFRRTEFLEGLEKELRPLELKARMLAIARRLGAGLPKAPAEAFPLLIAALEPDPKTGEPLKGFRVWPLTQVIVDLGLHPDHFALSMQALHAMTQVFTGEFAIRPFLAAYEQRTLEQLKAWCEDPNEHVRRLASEGSRPYLPWGQKLPRLATDPSLTWPLLERLYRDESKYVRTSVANHINDHTRLHPKWVTSQVHRMKANSEPTLELERLIHRGLRNLVKKGNASALALCGVVSKGISIEGVQLRTKEISVGQTLIVEVTVANATTKAAKVVIDHELGLLKAGGKTSIKVFKGKTFELGPKSREKVGLKIPLRKVTTRTYYSGRHSWTAIVNGTRSATKAFVLNAG